jgi:Calpain family cysteine protease
MKFSANPSSPQKTNKQRAPLSLEQLETRMLMAVDMLEQSFADLNSPAVPLVQSTPVVRNLAGSLQVVGTNSAIINGQRIQSSEFAVRVQLLRDSSGNLPAVSWGITSNDALARGSVQVSGDIATLTFNRPADYRVTTTGGSRNLVFTVRVTPSLSTLQVLFGRTQLTQDPLSVVGRQTTLNVSGLDQLGRSIRLSSPVSWQVEQAPEGSSPQFQVSGVRTKITFDRAGSYTLRATSGSVSTTVRISVVQMLSGIAVTPGTGTVGRNESLQFTATGLDQFQQPMGTQPSFQWSATGGTISNQGRFQAGNTQGSFRVTVSSGRIQGRANLTISGGQSNNGINDANLRNLVSTFYADSTISRDEMTQILRSVGSDNTVSATELTDLRHIVSTTASLRMPELVRTLAKNVVTSNPANLRYQGQTAGNLAAGSTAVLLNNLVDKWFLGSDVPTITGNGISYQFAVGSLFPNAPSLEDSKQGMLGDCYFLASLISIGAKNPTAIRNMFVENSDGTVTVRFYANGVADFVTVDRRLPTFSNGSLAYSGYGRSVLSSSTQLWLALAEKAYAQWNETGKSGRNGTNTYAAIEGGWMGTVNAQALGYESSNYVVNSTNKQNLINALNGNQAVTIGTTSGASAGGLVGSHAYVVTGYNSTTDTFSFYNPWSVQHPTGLTWNQMQGQTSYFVVASPAGSSFNGTRVSNSVVDPNSTYANSANAVASFDADQGESESSQAPEVLQNAWAAIEFDPAKPIECAIAQHPASQAVQSSEETPENVAGLLADLGLMSLEA